MSEPLTPPPILNAIAESPSGLTPRVWARWFSLLQEQAGTPGPQGEQGEPGPAGPAGPQGDPGTPATLGPTLTTIEALTGLVDTALYFTGTDVAALTALTALARTLLAGSTTAAMQGTLGLGTVATQSYEEGTFTVTGTGFTTTVTGTARYVRVGKQLTVMLPLLTGTSNATTFTVTGVPSALRPVEDTRFLVRVTNNGVLAVTMAAFPASTGILTLAADITGGAFTASGTKALANMPVSYLLP